MSGRSRAAGLPSGPGPRSRSAARSADRDRDRGGRSEYDSDGGASSRSARRVRPQGRADPRPPPVPRHNPTSSDDRRSDSTYRSDSTTSSGSSFLDRIKQGTGYASSRTSLEDEAPQKPRSMRSRPAREESPDEENEAPPPGDGYNIWSKVTSAASSLSVNVGKAWAANITTHTGEDTPAGQESRLTRAMKAYHVEKARDPSDLPAWLFDEQERRRPAPAAAPSSRSRRRDDDEYDVVETTRAEPPPSRGLRDIYEAAASSTAQPTKQASNTRTMRSYADDSPQPSKATDRLKALRDAKRTAVAPTAVREERRDAPRAEERETETPRRRIGLPSGPVSRR